MPSPNSYDVIGLGQTTCDKKLCQQRVIQISLKVDNLMVNQSNLTLILETPQKGATLNLYADLTFPIR